jgi:histidyl-tRNA synthetase
MTYTVVRGTKDILPSETPLWQFIENTARNLFHRYHYSEIRTPIFEELSLFNRVMGNESDIVKKEMYNFTDKGGRELALRPEGTASVARAYLSNALQRQAGETKVYYMGPMFRYERPQAGRYRQFHQIGLECIGSSHPYTDAEIITLCYRLFSELGLNKVNIRINSVGCLHCRDSIRTHVINYFTPHLHLFNEQQKETFKHNPLRILDSKDPAIKALILDGFDLNEALCDQSKTHFASVLTYLDALNIPYIYTPTLVRGLDYYTETVFEVVSDELGAQNSICGGGRYNHLIRDIGGPDTPAFGFAFGLERLVLLLDQQPNTKLKPDSLIYVAALGQKAALKSVSLMETLRQEGLSVTTDYKKTELNPHIKLADKLKAEFIIILGDQELDSQTVIVKHLQKKQQNSIPINDLSSYFKRISEQD